MPTKHIELPERINRIIEAIHINYDLARANDRYFDADNYIWFIGKHVLDDLQCCFDSYIAFDNKDQTANMLRGIRVELDILNPDGLRLFKEIK